MATLHATADPATPVPVVLVLASGRGERFLASGGRGAKLWELYQKRHREIATSAESRFLGDIGADFRNAYEEE